MNGYMSWPEIQHKNAISKAKEGFMPPEPVGNLLWYAVDFDGTIAESKWTIDNPTSVPGEPITVNVHKLYKLKVRGYKVVIHTARPWSDYNIIEAWMNHHEIPFDKIVCGKLLAHRYIDDRAINADDDWFGLDCLADKCTDES